MNNKNIDLENVGKSIENEKFDSNSMKKTILDQYEFFVRKRSEGRYFQYLAILFLFGSILCTMRGDVFGYFYLFLAILSYIPYSIIYKANREADFKHLEYLSKVYLVSSIAEHLLKYKGEK